jgi:hypothetical protein
MNGFVYDLDFFHLTSDDTSDDTQDTVTMPLSAGK